MPASMKQIARRFPGSTMATRALVLVLLCLVGAWARAAEIGAGPPVDEAAIVRALAPRVEAAGRGLRIERVDPTDIARPADAQAPRPTAGPVLQPSLSLPIEFGEQSVHLTTASRQVVETLARALASERLAPFSFRIEGCADPATEKRNALSLSRARAEAVRRQLISHGRIAPDRLRAVGRAGRDAIDAASGASSRRVSIVTELDLAALQRLDAREPPK